MAAKKQILSKEEINLKLERLAYQIYENNLDEKEIILAGIQKRGYAIAVVLQERIQRLSKMKVSLISVEIDKRNPIDSHLSETKGLDKKAIIVIDDVANSGRTLLYALHPFLHVIAKRIQIGVLVDRKHKSYPICADYIGVQLSTTVEEHIKVEIEKGQITGAYLH